MITNVIINIETTKHFGNFYLLIFNNFQQDDDFLVHFGGRLAHEISPRITNRMAPKIPIRKDFIARPAMKAITEQMIETIIKVTATVSQIDSADGLTA